MWWCRGRSDTRTCTANTEKTDVSVDPAAFLHDVAQQGGQCMVPEWGDQGKAAQALIDAGLLDYVTVDDPFLHFQLQMTQAGWDAVQT